MVEYIPHTPPDGLGGGNSGTVGAVGVAVVLRRDLVSCILYLGLCRRCWRSRSVALTLYPGHVAVLLPASSSRSVYGRAVDWRLETRRPEVTGDDGADPGGLSVIGVGYTMASKRARRRVLGPVVGGGDGGSGSTM